jgi:threonine-phosphate decarboxylase
MIEGHGDDRHRYGPETAIRADFSSNIPGGIDHSALRAHLASRLHVIEHYPEPEPLTLEGELADSVGLSPREVVVTNGATEAIYLVAHLLARSATGGETSGPAAIVEPTFAEYRDACRLYGGGVEPLSIADPYDPPAGCRSVWCCNPNNPTGRAWERDRLLAAIDSRPEVTFVVDQSYEAFTLRPTISAAEARARHNLIVIHSMTKRYAVPGLRLGWLTAPESLCVGVRRLRMPWSVNALAIEAGRFLLREGVGGFSLRAMLDEAARLARAIECTGVFAHQYTDTHFMLVEIAPGAGVDTGADADTAAGLKEWLVIREGILIRDAANFRGLTPRHFRVAAQSAAENDLLIDALGRWRRWRRC